MGAGKSYCAHQLGEYFAVPVFDTDSLIEKQAGKTITEIFTQPDGEMYFRELERDLLRQKIWPEGCIISCGGGLPCFFDNLQYMQDHGMVIWLNSDVNLIAKRLWKEKSLRPLVSASASPAELEQKIREILTKREPVYSLAHIEWNGEGGVEILIKKIETYLQGFHTA